MPSSSLLPLYPTAQSSLAPFISSLSHSSDTPALWWLQVARLPPNPFGRSLPWVPLWQACSSQAYSLGPDDHSAVDCTHLKLDWWRAVTEISRAIEMRSATQASKSWGRLNAVKPRGLKIKAWTLLLAFADQSELLLALSRSFAWSHHHLSQTTSLASDLAWETTRRSLSESCWGFCC